MKCGHPKVTKERPFCGFPSCNDPLHWRGESTQSKFNNLLSAMEKTVDKETKRLLKGKSL